MELSVIICTYNPRLDYLNLTLDGLKAQTLPLDRWELVIIDNASNEPLEALCDLSWHPKSRIVREEKLGLMHARLRAVEETQPDLIIYVDDDNLLDSNYLESARALAEENPWLGSFGAASITPRYERAPAPELRRWCGGLTLRNENQNLFSNHRELRIAPVGAGMCVRRCVAEALVEKEKRSKWPVFDRKGESLMSSGDFQFPMAAADCGMGYGIFASLSLVHLIPTRRIQLKYLLAINEAISYSTSLLNRLRQHELGVPERSNPRELAMFLGYVLNIAKAKGVDRKFWWGSARGQWKALRDYRQLAHTSLSEN